MYLSEPVAKALLSTLAALAGPASRLAVDFVARGGGSVALGSRMLTAVIRRTLPAGGGQMLHWIQPGDATRILAEAGWTPGEITRGPDLAARYLPRAAVPVGGINPEAFVATATLDGSSP